MVRAGDGAALLANIGGTHARFGLALPAHAGRPRILALKQYLAADFATLTAAASRYLEEAGIEAELLRGVFAVASAVTGDLVKITNNPWTFSTEAVRHDLGLSGIQVINDFCALSRALPLLGEDDVRLVGAARARPHPPGGDATYAVVGPGTGLGVGCLAVRHGQAAVIESEGGHVSFAPNDGYEAAILERLAGRFGRVSAERLISGAGLLNLYQAVCSIEGVPAEPGSPADITARAAAEPAGRCGRAVDLFCELLGSFAGDVALMFGSWDGVFLAGGVVQKILPWLLAGGFRRRFEAKGRHQSLMQAIPVRVILHSHAELLGAAGTLGAAFGSGAAAAGPALSELRI